MYPSLFTFFNSRSNKSPAPNLSEVRELLVIRVDEFGDTILTAPFLNDLRNSAPRANIRLLTRPKMAPLFELLPWLTQVATIDEKLVYDWKKLSTFGKVNRAVKTFSAVRNQFHGVNFDLAIVPRWDTDYYNAGLAALCSGAKHRIGFSENVNLDKKRLNTNFDRFYTHVFDRIEGSHEVERSLSLLSGMGASLPTGDWPAIDLPNADAEFVDGLLEQDRGYIAIAPGGRIPLKVWPAECYIELIQLLVENRDISIVILGGGEVDLSIATDIASQTTDLINLVGKTSWSQDVAVLRRCSLFIGNDSATKHLAAWSGTPIIEISSHPKNGDSAHYTSPARFSAWRANSSILQPSQCLPPCISYCSSAYAHCIKQVSVQNVFEIALSLLAESPKSEYEL